MRSPTLSAVPPLAAQRVGATGRVLSGRALRRILVTPPLQTAAACF